MKSNLALTREVQKLEMMDIERSLRANNGVRSRAVRSLGITERILGYKMKIYKISLESNPKR